MEFSELDKWISQNIGDIHNSLPGSAFNKQKGWEKLERKMLDTPLKPSVKPSGNIYSIYIVVSMLAASLLSNDTATNRRIYPVTVLERDTFQSTDSFKRLSNSATRSETVQTKKSYLKVKTGIEKVPKRVEYSPQPIMQDIIPADTSIDNSAAQSFITDSISRERFTIAPKALRGEIRDFRFSGEGTKTFDTIPLAKRVAKKRRPKDRPKQKIPWHRSVRFFFKRL